MSRTSSESLSRTSSRTFSWHVAWQIWSKSGAEIVNTNFSGDAIVNVIRMSTFVRTLSRVGIEAAGASNGVSRVVTMWLTMIHGGAQWLPGPSVRWNRPPRSRTACEPSGTGTRNDWNTPRTMRSPAIPRNPPRAGSVRSRRSPITRTTTPAITSSFRMRNA